MIKNSAHAMKTLTKLSFKGLITAKSYFIIIAFSGYNQAKPQENSLIAYC